MKVWQIQVPLLNSRNLQARAIYLRMIYNNVIHGVFFFFPPASTRGLVWPSATTCMCVSTMIIQQYMNMQP